MGTKLDQQRREALAREDTSQRQYDIESTRLYIFGDASPVAGAYVDRKLKETSQVPVRVSSML